MGRIKGHYEWDDDHLTPGQKKEGGLHQNLFDSGGNLKGSARFIPDDGSEGEPFLVTETVYVPVEQRRRTQDEEELDRAIVELVFHFVKWGIGKAKPYAEQRRLRRSRRRKTAVANATMIKPARKLAEALGDGRPNMSRAEARARLLAGLRICGWEGAAEHHRGR